MVDGALDVEFWLASGCYNISFHILHLLNVVLFYDSQMGYVLFFY